MLSNNVPWATIGLWILTLIVAVVGGGVVIWGSPGALSFQTYVEVLGGFAVSHGLLGIGRGLNSGLTNHAMLSAPLRQEEVLPPQGELEASASTAKHV